MYNKEIFGKKKKIVIILRGGSAVGKSSIADALEKKYPFLLRLT